VCKLPDDLPTGLSVQSENVFSWLYPSNE